MRLEVGSGRFEVFGIQNSKGKIQKLEENGAGCAVRHSLLFSFLHL
jgi:hypothetical protein